jgi:hypothetical protein
MTTICFSSFFPTRKRYVGANFVETRMARPGNWGTRSKWSTPLSCFATLTRNPTHVHLLASAKTRRGCHFSERHLHSSLKETWERNAAGSALERIWVSLHNTLFISCSRIFFYSRHRTCVPVRTVAYPMLQRVLNMKLSYPFSSCQQLYTRSRAGAIIMDYFSR